MKILFALLPILLHAVILQSDRIEDVVPHVDPLTVVFFDVDDTLFTSNVQLGKSLRFLDEWDILIKLGMDEELALQICREHWDAIQKKCLIRHLEPEVKAVLETVQKRALYTMALTARGPRTIEITNDQLRSLGLDFTAYCPITLQAELPIEHHYQDGIWYIERNEKGLSVRKWLDTLSTHPRKIVLVDDTYRHLTNMEENLSDLEIEFIGIHYTKAQENPYCPKIAQIQADYFPEIISDEEAFLFLQEQI